jgi:hypothetical protein
MSDLSVWNRAILSAGLILFGLYAPTLTGAWRDLDVTGLPAMVLLLMAGLSIYLAWVGRGQALVLTGLVSLIATVGSFIVVMRSWWEGQAEVHRLLDDLDPQGSATASNGHWPPISMFVPLIVLLVGVLLLIATGRSETRTTGTARLK